MSLLSVLLERARSAVTAFKAPHLLPNEGQVSSEVGMRPTPENAIRNLYRRMWVDSDLRQAILDVREMDRADPRVKTIHRRVARDTIQGGLVFAQSESGGVLAKEWDGFARRLQLNRDEKLRSDARGLVMEGNLPLQVVLDPAYNVVAAVRMPTETLVPQVDAGGRFIDPARAYVQRDLFSGAIVAEFALWQLMLIRFDPDNYDDMGALGRPFLDASRTHWRKLTMTEEDLVIRRRTRAPLRMAHVLEGASDSDITEYRKRVEADQGEITTDFYLNRKGGVAAVAGDAALGEIADVVHLMDTFFAGGPFPKGLMGFTDGMARDILEDLKRDYYEEVDSLQDMLAFAYESTFRLHLLLKGMDPGPDEFQVGFAARMTETANQTADRALKWRALGLPNGLVWREMGLNPARVRDELKAEAESTDPYPQPESIGIKGNGPARPSVKVTPGNAPKGESATSVGNG